MKQKNTVYVPSGHVPFQESKDELRKMKENGEKNTRKDNKEGLSEYRKRLATKGK